MRPRRVTVRIDGLRIVVPLNRDGATIQELIDAASLRFQKATGISASRIQRLELENGGILDPDDIVDDVLNYETEEVLAISDDDPSIPSESSSYYPADTRDKTAIPSTSASSEAFVEIKAFDSTPTLHVRSSKTKAHFGNELLMAEAAPLRSSLRSDKREHNSAPRTVTLSPEVERRLIQTEHRNALERISARKSRISDKFWDAQEKLRDSMSSGSQPGIPRSVSDSNGFVKKPSLIQSIENPFHTIVILANTEELDVGIEITDEFDTPRATPSSAFQITKIDSDGRVGKDGRIRTGDMIVAIDGHSANGLTLLKARALLYELRTRPAPTLTIDRTIQSFHEAEAKVISQKKMALSALQQANSQAVGQTFTITIVRKPNGFGFTVTGRGTTKGERLCYIGNVKPDGPAFGQLRSGDRLIKVNGVPTVELQQADIVRRLKETPVGESVTLEISRLAETNDENQPPASTSNAAIEVAEKEAEIVEKKEEGTPPAPRSIHKARLVNTSNDIKEYSFDIPLNDTGSAGLGLSLKARVSIKDDGSRRDCGIFIKKLLVGGAAWKDGRLLVDDQLISIEDIDLRKFEKNADASEAVTKELKRIGHTTSHVRLRVLRQIVVLSSDVSSDGSTRVTVDGPDSTILIGGPATPQSGFFSINNHHERDASYASTSTRRSEVEEDLQPDAGAFDREAPGRKSMSEKRGMGATIDPINSTTYQKIKHQRQTSAPTSSASRSFRQNRSASTRAAAKARSVSVHPRPTTSTDGERSDTNPPRDPAIDYLDVGPGATTARRRSKSVDANLATSQMRPDDPQAPQMLPTSLSTGFKNPSFKHAVAGEIGPSQDLSPVIAQRFGAARTSDKQQRRKSIGSTMKSWLRIGARSREQSPEKEPAHPHFLAQPGQDYETVLTSTPLNRRDFRRDKVQSEYDPVFAEPQTITSPTKSGFKVANSTFYMHARDSTTANGPAPVTPSKLPTTMSNTAGAHISLRTMAPPPPPHNKGIAGVASRTPPKETTPNAHPHHLITQFPVRTPTRETTEGIIHAHNSPRWDQKHHQDAANDNQHHQRAIDHRHPPTMMHSMHGSRTRAEERLGQDLVSRPLSLEGCAHPLLLNPTPERVVRSINRQPSAPQITTSNVILHSPTRHLGPAHPPMPRPISQHQSTPPQHNIINNNPTSSPSRRLQDSQFIQTPRISLDSFVRLRHSQQEPRTAGSPISNNPQQRLSLRAKKRQQRRAVQSEYVDAPLNAFPPTWRSIPIHREAPPPPSAATAQRNPSYLSATLLHKDPLRTSPRVSSRL